MKKRFWIVTLALMLGAVAGHAQTVSGLISGTVLDASNLPLVTAKVTLVHESTQNTRTATPDQSGDFLFTAVSPGAYTIKIEAAGFAAIETRNLNLTANERLRVGKLVLKPSAVAETITVSARGTAVETENNDRSAVLTSDQIQRLTSRGNNFTGLLTLLPGAVPGEGASFESSSLSTSTGPSFAGLSNATVGFAIDGLHANDISNPNYLITPIAMDSIDEVKVLMNNYKAESGRNGGTMVTVVTKGGTTSFHGSLYDNERNESLNANNFFNNSNGVKRPKYRFMNVGGTFGGPVYVPGKFNRNKDKLFVFFSEDVTRSLTPQNLVQVTVPTALERTGDFSQTVDLNGKAITITDPLNNKLPFAGNVVPSNRLDPNGQKLLSLLPLPNFFDIATSKRNYNYNFQESIHLPQHAESLRLDYNATSKVRLFFRGTTYYVQQIGYNYAAGVAWNMIKSSLATYNPGITTSVTYVVTPRIVSETSLGLTGTREQMSPAVSGSYADWSRAKTGINTPQIYPQNNPLGIIPWASFGGVTNPANLATRNDFPDRLWGQRTPLSETLTYARGPHTVKGGFSAQRARMFRRTGATFAGSLDFANDGNNPLNTGFAYSNAVLGIFRQYTESDSRPNTDLRSTLIDWYIQDTWKVTRRLTVDVGMRFSWASPYAQANDIGNNFVPSLFDPARKVTLFAPILDASKARVAVNPLTGELAGAALIGAVVPNSGVYFNGRVFANTPGIPRGYLENRGVQYGPRVGFAYDVLGNGKMALRAGFGTTYQMQTNPTTFTITNAILTPGIFNSTLQSFSPNAGVLMPVSVTAVNPKIKTPTIYNYSAGVQRDVGFGTVVDVAYVAALGRQLTQTEALNTLPYGTRFLPQSMDPTRPGSPLPDTFLEPYLGYSGISIPRTSSSNYHSLQAQANRRFSKGLQFGVSYTWSKSMGYTGNYPVYLNNRLSYGKTSLDRTHMLSINALYDLPQGSKLWNVPVMRAVTDKWQMSVVPYFSSGRPWAVGYSLTSGTDLTGGGDWIRAVVLSDPTLPHGDRTFSRFFNTSVFAPPTKGTIGNAPVDVFRGPGRCNLDVALFKNFKIVEKISAQFRFEAFNVLNHVSFWQVDNTARFDATGAQVNARFGQEIAAMEGRVLKISVRISF